MARSASTRSYAPARSSASAGPSSPAEPSAPEQTFEKEFETFIMAWQIQQNETLSTMESSNKAADLDFRNVISAIETVSDSYRYDGLNAPLHDLKNMYFGVQQTRDEQLMKLKAESSDMFRHIHDEAVKLWTTKGDEKGLREDLELSRYKAKMLEKQLENEKLETDRLREMLNGKSFPDNKVPETREESRAGRQKVPPPPSYVSSHHRTASRDFQPRQRSSSRGRRHERQEQEHKGMSSTRSSSNATSKPVRRPSSRTISYSEHRDYSSAKQRNYPTMSDYGSVLCNPFLDSDQQTIYSEHNPQSPRSPQQPKQPTSIAPSAEDSASVWVDDTYSSYSGPRRTSRSPDRLGIDLKKVNEDYEKRQAAIALEKEGRGMQYQREIDEVIRKNREKKAEEEKWKPPKRNR